MNTRMSGHPEWVRGQILLRAQAWLETLRFLVNDWDRTLGHLMECVEYGISLEEIGSSNQELKELEQRHRVRDAKEAMLLLRAGHGCYELERHIVQRSVVHGRLPRCLSTDEDDLATLERRCRERGAAAILAKLEQLLQAAQSRVQLVSCDVDVESVNLRFASAVSLVFVCNALSAGVTLPELGLTVSDARTLASRAFGD